MKNPLRIPVARLVAILGLSVGSVFGQQYGPQTFDVPDDTTDLEDGTTIASSDGMASVQIGALRMTEDGTQHTRSSFRIPALASSSEGWTASFEFVLEDLPDENNPADGFSFSYGAIPDYVAGLIDPTSARAHGFAEEGWGEGVEHISFEFDTWDNGNGEQGFNIAHNGDDLGFENQTILQEAGRVVGTVAISWSPTQGASLSVDLGFGLTPVFSNVPTPGFNGDDDYVFAIGARTGGATQTLIVDNVQVTTIPPGFIVLPSPVISEFMADNQSTIEDENCRASDWIEIFNATARAVDFDGWYLTDDLDEPRKWRIPAFTLQANKYKLIFASGEDQTTGELHTDFRLRRSGGFVALVRPNGSIASAYQYDQQVEDAAFGTLGQGQEQGFFFTPTPGTANRGPQGVPVLDKPEFSLESQLFSGRLSLELTAPGQNATIRYTTNGSEPNSRSRLYTGPITIGSTTRIIARIFESGLQPGPVRERTFVKMATNLQNFDSDLPIIVIDSFGRNLDNESSANSQNPRRPVHGIFFDIDPETGRASPQGIPDFEGAAGMRVRGQTSSGFPKKQYSFETWDSEGNDKDVSIFGMPSESDWIIHAPYSDKTLMRNKIVYDTSREIGYPAVRTRFCELFYNPNGGDVSMADYRGVYVFMENIKANEDRVPIKRLDPCDTAEPAVTGGYIWKKDKGANADVTFSTIREGHTMAFVEPDAPSSRQRIWLDRYVDQFETALHRSNFDDPELGYARYIDVQSFIDTHIWVEVYKNIDGYRLSSYFYKDRGKKIVAGPVWDYNLSLGNANYLSGENASGWYYSLISPQQYPYYSRLFRDPEFVIQYWDRYFELREGILSEASMLNRIDSYTDEIEEGARRNFSKWRVLGTHLWPNASGSSSRRTHQSEVDWMKNWLRNRLRWIDQQHSRPPRFSVPGGPVSAGTNMTISNPNSGGGFIYYTTDGSDPRLPGNSSESVFLPESSECRYLIPEAEIPGWETPAGPLDLAEWRRGQAGLGYQNPPGPLLAQINTHVPPGTTTVYARFNFEIEHASTLSAIDSLTLDMKYEDGFVAYLNGTRVASANSPGSLTHESLATGDHNGAAAVEFESFNLNSHRSRLVQGANVLAIQFLNRGSTKTGFLGSPELIATTSRATLSPSAQRYTDGVYLGESATVKARVLRGSVWSPVQTEHYLVSGEPAGPSNLAVSEINYRPISATEEEANTGFDRRTDYEYLEVMNIGEVPIDLTGVKITEGVQFDFNLGEVSFLEPGERAVIVSDRIAFENRYRAILNSIKIAGEFSNSLSNDGETIIITAADGSEIRNFTYNDVDPWPEAADGDGMSLVLIAPFSNPDHNDPLSWRSSRTENGVPGREDGSTFVGNPAGDDDGNGINNFFQYALAPDGVEPILPKSELKEMTVGEVTADFMTLTYTRRQGADDVEYDMQVSDDLVTWIRQDQNALTLLSRVENPDGTETISFRVSQPTRWKKTLFGRLSVRSREP